MCFNCILIIIHVYSGNKDKFAYQTTYMLTVCTLQVNDGLGIFFFALSVRENVDCTLFKLNGSVQMTNTSLTLNLTTKYLPCPDSKVLPTTNL